MRKKCLDSRYSSTSLLAGLLLGFTTAGLYHVSFYANQGANSGIIKYAMPVPVRNHSHKRVVFWHVANNDVVVSQALEELKAAASLYAADVKYSAHPPTSPAILNVLRGEDWLTEIPLDRQRFPDDATRSYYEFPTLSAVHEHCTEFPEDFVAYVHTKSDEKKRRDYMSKIFPLYATYHPRNSARHLLPMGNSCVDALERGRAACGVNPRQAKALKIKERGASWCHFSGNFWWARCDYVKKLNHPWHSEASAELWWENPSGFGAYGKGHSRHQHRDTRAFGRYFAEWWLLNDIKLNVLKKETSSKRNQGNLSRWLAAYAPDSAGVWRRPHVVNDTFPVGKPVEECWTDADTAFNTTGNWCVTQAARRLARKLGKEAVWQWPATCPGALLFESYWGGFASAENFGFSTGWHEAV